MSLRAVRDLLTQEADKVIIDSGDGYGRVLAFLDGCAPGAQGVGGAIRGEGADI